MKTKLFFLSMIFLACSDTSAPQDHLNLYNKLNGSWQAEAFSGSLHEEWILENDGWMLQEGHYIENNDTTYSAATKIQQINDETVLISIIKNADPKIFKAVKNQSNEMVFENKEYKNPFRVKYEFLSDSTYKRTITGYESDSLVSYTFNFVKVGGSK